MMPPLLLSSTWRWRILLLLGIAVSPVMVGGIQAAQWHEDLSNFPPIALDQFDRLDELYRRLESPRSESFVDWRHSWHESRTKISLDYGGKHPFELHNSHHRREQSSSAPSDNNSHAYQPIRIAYITDPLQQSVAGNHSDTARINYILSTVLPQVQNTWSSHLKVFPIPSTQRIRIDTDVCFGLFYDSISSSILQNGISNADLVIIVTSSDILTSSDGTSIDFCGTGTLAVSVLCAQDQFDRPLIGLMNFCPPNSTATETSQQGSRRRKKRRMQGTKHDEAANVVVSSWPRQISLLSKQDLALVTIHELGHTLGMNAELFPYFRNPITGEPLTPRPISYQNVTCTGGRGNQYIPFPSNDTLQMGINPKGEPYYDIVTPRVRVVARNQFNCPTLRGARLENQDTSASCVGSHWDQRLFFSELMGSVFWGTADVLSPLTLALLEDTGWYQVDYGNAKLSPFGQGVGCDFVEGSCIVNDTLPESGNGYFCSKPTTIQPTGLISVNDTDLICDPSHYEWAVCALFDVEQVPFSFQEKMSSIPIRYFSNPNLVGIFPQSDYCPMPIIPAHVACTDSSTLKMITYVGEQYGSASRCINAYQTSASGSQRYIPGCFEIECDAAAFQVIVNGVACQYDFQEITINTIFAEPATMICPRLSTICPDLFCPGDCSARGFCNYNQRPPLCECYDTSDTSSNCGGASNGLTLTSLTLSPTSSPATSPLPVGVLSPTLTTTAPTMALFFAPIAAPSQASPTFIPATSYPTLFATPEPSTSGPTSSPIELSPSSFVSPSPATTNHFEVQPSATQRTIRPTSAFNALNNIPSSAGRRVVTLLSLTWILASAAFAWALL